MIITIESWHQLIELHHQKSMYTEKSKGCTTEETLIEIDVEIKSIKERIEEIIKKRLAK